MKKNILINKTKQTKGNFSLCSNILSRAPSLHLNIFQTNSENMIFIDDNRNCPLPIPQPREANLQSGFTARSPRRKGSAATPGPRFHGPKNENTAKYLSSTTTLPSSI